jgi:hypothetical protein
MVKFTSVLPAALAIGSALAIPSDSTGTAAQRHQLTKRQSNVIGAMAKPFINRMRSQGEGSANITNDAQLMEAKSQIRQALLLSLSK